MTCGDPISYRERRLTNHKIIGVFLLCQELLATYKSRNAPFICPFILRNRNMPNSRNFFSKHHIFSRQVSFHSLLFLHSAVFVHIFIWIFLTFLRIYSAFSLQNARVNTTLSQHVLILRHNPSFIF